MLDNYFPILIFICIGAVVGFAPLVLGRILGPYRPYKEKNAAYECGFPAFADARSRFDIRFYLLAIIFILFDLEIAFLVPWALVINQISLAAFDSMFLFLVLLLLGYV